MTERDRLKKLLNEAFIKSDDNHGMPNTNQVADYLVANGVVVLPCKVGDTMFITIGDSIIRYEIKRFEIDDLMIWAKGVNNDYARDAQTVIRCISFDLGKTIFLSEEEAEKALEDMRKEDEGT